jgi:hypothetical protein
MSKNNGRRTRLRVQSPFDTHRLNALNAKAVEQKGQRTPVPQFPLTTWKLRYRFPPPLAPLRARAIKTTLNDLDE